MTSLSLIWRVEDAGEVQSESWNFFYSSIGLRVSNCG